MSSVVMSLGDLADPTKYTEPLKLGSSTADALQAYLDKMIEIRLAEEAIADLVVDGKVGTPCHLGIGQEAIPVGISTSLTSRDRVFGGHRSHSQYLALGADLTALFAEVLGRASGASRGMGGSMHLFDANVGFHGSVPIVAGTISIAVGAALAAKMDGSDAVAVCYFGDGAAEEGVLHESLNLAAAYDLPVLFVCENNLFSSHLDIDIRQPGNRVARYADAHGVRSETIDGNDVVLVRDVAADMVGDIRKSRKPGFLEAVTYRHRGHVGPNEDVDVGVHRTMDELRQWKTRDPIKRLSDAMLASKMIDEDGLQEVHHTVRERVDAAVAAAKKAPQPDADQLLSFVYSESHR